MKKQNRATPGKPPRPRPLAQRVLCSRLPELARTRSGLARDRRHVVPEVVTSAHLLDTSAVIVDEYLAARCGAVVVAAEPSMTVTPLLDMAPLVASPAAASPLVMPTVLAPAVIESTIIAPAVIDPVVVEPPVVEPSVIEPADAEPLVVASAVVEQVVAAPATTAAVGNSLSLRGEYWEVCFDDCRGVVQDCRGLRYLAVLLRDAASGKDPIHAKELAALGSGQAAGAIELETTDDVLDDTAQKELMARLEELTSERDRACAAEDFARAEALEEEYERIVTELSRAAGVHGGRRRGTFIDSSEKARKAVAKAITEAIARVAKHPELTPFAQHLKSTIRKGQWLSYGGDSQWTIDLDSPLLRK